jgi:hypothetical protein
MGKGENGKRRKWEKEEMRTRSKQCENKVRARSEQGQNKVRTRSRSRLLATFLISSCVIYKNRRNHCEMIGLTLFYKIYFFY